MDSLFIISASKDCTFKIYNVAKGFSLQQSVKASEKPLLSAVFNPDLSYIASGGMDTNIVVIHS